MCDEMLPVHRGNGEGREQRKLRAGEQVWRFSEELLTHGPILASARMKREQVRNPLHDAVGGFARR
jgi:hypothetical protein